MPEIYQIDREGGIHLLIHFVYLTDAGLDTQRGSGFIAHSAKKRKQSEHIACAPQADLQAPRHGGEWPFHRASDPRAVTCGACKESDAYKLALQAIEEAHAYEQGRISG